MSQDDVTSEEEVELTTSSEETLNDSVEDNSHDEPKKNQSNFKKLAKKLNSYAKRMKTSGHNSQHKLIVRKRMTMKNLTSIQSKMKYSPTQSQKSGSSRTKMLKITEIRWLLL